MTERLTVDMIDALITDTHLAITSHSAESEARAWRAIDSLLDRRNKLTGHR